MFVSEAITDVLKPKPKKEISDMVSKLSVKEKTSLLIEKGVEKFFGAFEDFVEFIEDNLTRLEFDSMWKHIIEDFDDLEHEYVDREWIIKEYSTSSVAQFMVDSLSEEQIDKFLRKLVPGFVTEKKTENIVISEKNVVNLLIEDLEDYLAPKDKSEMIEDTKKLSFDQKYNLVHDLWYGNDFKFVIDIRNYIGGFKFDEMLAELIVLKQRGEM